MTENQQRLNIATAARSLADLILAGHSLVITHGNGPQIGLLALQAASGPGEAAYPLDILGAETDGMIGYMIEQQLRNALPAGRQLATVLTQIRVDAADPAFAKPTKPIGPGYDKAGASRLQDERGWQFAGDGDRMRRVVPSPLPVEIIDLPVIRLLVDNNIVVICAGGGGIPVVRQAEGQIKGIEAVIDKDRASALLAVGLHADRLLLLTDVDAVYLDYGTPTARAVTRAGAESVAAGTFAAGSMGPKVEAAAQFASATGHPAAIGRLEDALALLNGKAGTRIEAGSAAWEFAAG
nr:carbamate kinase [uncultured Gellertiella sp.]